MWDCVSIQSVIIRESRLAVRLLVIDIRFKLFCLAHHVLKLTRVR